jgi:hypothetical protein
MDQGRATSEQQEATPIFNAYRRGYDPEQVDRYVSEQQRRLDEALERASESERKLAAAIGQLRELHRRVALLESEERSSQSQAPTLDALGERVQRIMQEAWEGAYALRQTAEREVVDLRNEVAREVTQLREGSQREVTEERESAHREVTEMLEAAQRRAFLMREETERRRQAYLERVEEDRERAVTQITYLYDQRQQALGELSRLQATIESTVEEMARSPLGVPSVGARGPRSRSLGRTPARAMDAGDLLVDTGPMPAVGAQPSTSSEKPGSVYGAPDAGIPAPDFSSSTPPETRPPASSMSPRLSESPPPASRPASAPAQPAPDQPAPAGRGWSVPGFPTEGPSDRAPVSQAAPATLPPRTPAVRITTPPVGEVRAREAGRQEQPRRVPEARTGEGGSAGETGRGTHGFRPDDTAVHRRVEAPPRSRGKSAPAHRRGVFDFEDE